MPDNTRKQQLEEMLKEEPNDPFLHYGLAMEFVGEGDDAEAVRRFRALLEVAPEYVPGYHQAGQALVRLGRYEEARTLFSRGIATARNQANEHAAQEMEGFLANLG